MKKIIVLLLVSVMAVCLLCACGGGATSKEGDIEESVAATTEESTENESISDGALEYENAKTTFANACGINLPEAGAVDTVIFNYDDSSINATTKLFISLQLFLDEGGEAYFNEAQRVISEKLGDPYYSDHYLSTDDTHIRWVLPNEQGGSIECILIYEPDFGEVVTIQYHDFINPIDY